MRAQRLFATRIALFLLLGATYFLYSTALSFGFVYDDVFQIVDNQRLDSAHFLPSFFTQHVWAHVPGVTANLYRPVFLLWLFANNQLFSHEPAGWHFSTLLVHLTVVGLVYVLARKLLQDAAAGLISAALFAVHPVQVESVAWVSGVTEPLCAAFFLMAVLCYVRFRETAGAIRWLVGSLACYGLSILTKETAVVLPVLLLAYELSFGRHPETPEVAARLRLPAIGSYGGLAITYLVLRWLVLHGMAHRTATVSLGKSLIALPWLIWSYIRMLVVPARLSPLYDPLDVSRTTDLRFLLPTCGLAAAALLTWAFRRAGRLRVPGFLAAWFWLALAPALGVFIFASQSEGVHDRYLYLPSIAFCIFTGYAVQLWRSKLAGSRVNVLVSALPVVLISTMALATRSQIKYWSNNYTLFTRAENIAPKNVEAKLNLINELFHRQQYGEVLRLAKETQQLDPKSVPAFSAAGQAAYLLHDYQAAETYYARATELDPGRGDLFYSLGQARMQMEENNSAVDALRRAVALAPASRGFHYMLGKALIAVGDRASAQEQFQQELLVDPQSWAAHAALQPTELRPKGTKLLTSVRPQDLDPVSK